MHVYLISGIMSDERVFAKIQLPAGYHAKYVKFLPSRKKESLPDYAKRIAETIDTTQPFILLGFSFGGILATELSKILAPQLTIIVASATTAKELPPHFRFFRRSGIYKVVPSATLKIASIVKNIFILRNRQDRRSLINQALDTDSNFIGWVTRSVLCWNNTTDIKNAVRIHGDRDEVFPIKYVKKDIVLRGAHLLPFKNPDELNNAIAEAIGRTPKNLPIHSLSGNT